MYFKKVKENDKVFGLVFGKGIVTSVWGLDSHYVFEVTFDNGHAVPYTVDGIPGWSNIDIQTLFYQNDIDLMSQDFTTNYNILTPKKIIKLRTKNKLEVKCPSGIWQSIKNCPSYVIEEYIEKEQFHLFRKS